MQILGFLLFLPAFKSNHPLLDEKEYLTKTSLRGGRSTQKRQEEDCIKFFLVLLLFCICNLTFLLSHSCSYLTVQSILCIIVSLHSSSVRPYFRTTSNKVNSSKEMLIFTGTCMLLTDIMSFHTSHKLYTKNSINLAYLSCIMNRRKFSEAITLQTESTKLVLTSFNKFKFSLGARLSRKRWRQKMWSVWIQKFWVDGLCTGCKLSAS